MIHGFLKHLIAVLFCLVVVACKPAPEPEKPKGILRIATIPTDMPITVDGQLKGNSPSGEGQFFLITLEEGEHTIEILKTVDPEKEHYAKKTIFLAADTVAIVTLEAEQRLTPFGETEKQRRDVEKAEKERLVAERKEKQALIGKVKWSKTFGGSSYENARDVAVDSANNIWVMGSTGTYGSGSSDIYLVKTDGAGKKLFSKTYGTRKSESGYGIALASDGSAVLIGEHTDKYRNYNIFAIKISPTGDKVWERSYGGRKSDMGRAIITSYDNGFIIAGYADNGYNGYVVKLSASGDLLWEKKFQDMDFSSVQKTGDGNYLVGGRNNGKGVVVKINSDGEQVWKRTYGKKNYNVTIKTIEKLKDGNFLLGSDYRISEYDYDALVRKIKPSGEIIWEKRYSKSDSDSFSDLITLPDGGALLGGSYSPNPRGEKYQDDIFLIRIDENGNQKWSRVFGRSKTEYLYALKYTADEGLLLAGETKSRGAGSSDMYLVKLDNVLPEGISP